MELTQIQVKYLPAIEWLISDERASGRTTLMAYAFIKKAIITGEKVFPFDHFMPESFPNFHRSILPRIKQIAEDSFPQYNLHWYVAEKAFQMIPK